MSFGNHPTIIWMSTSNRATIVLQILLAMAAVLAPLTSKAGATHPGRLIAIGGAEDRGPDSEILQRFIELSGGQGARIVLLTAASINPARAGDIYRHAFAQLGVQQVDVVDARDRQEANDPAGVASLLAADGIFLSGGDQRRLMASIGGTAFERALRHAFDSGVCVAGTSAGAAVLSLHMLAEGGSPRLPEKDAARLDTGIGLVPEAIIDQHFSERRRLGRLLSVVAERPELLGLGIDEDTGLVIERGRAVEVIGKGSVTLLDGRQMRSNIAEARAHEPLEVLGMRLHLLPAGNRYPIADPTASLPPTLVQAVRLLVAADPHLE